MTDAAASLTIGAVAEATDVSVDVLRAWEARYGFPSPERQASGHRRYSARHVAQIRQVQRDRDAGLSLEAAIARTQAAHDEPEPSIYAGLRRRWPDLPVQVFSKRALTALSRAIEDECLALAERPLLVGCFQRERYYRSSERRWHELARTATWAAVLADFERTRVVPGAPIEIAIGPDDPLLREWVVVCDGPRLAACLAAVERAQDRHGGRRYETLWSVDPAVVRDAAVLTVELIEARASIAVPEPVPRIAADAANALRNATALLSRTLAHLDR